MSWILTENHVLPRISVGFVKFYHGSIVCAPYLLCSVCKSCAARCSTEKKQWLL